MPHTDIDGLDRDILNVLLKSGRKSFRQVAEEVGSTPATVINRVNSLQDKGVITGYRAELDYRELGYEGIAAVEIVVKGDGLEELKRQVEEHNNVVSAFTITGETDVLILVKFRDQEDLTEFVQEELVGSDTVERTITHMVMDVFKEQSEPEL